jgi:phosphoribosylglycinamide formyltransferase-1
VKRIVILASGSGSNAQAVIDAAQAGDFAAEVAAVVTNQPGAGVLRRAEAAGIATVVTPLANRRDLVLREAYNQQLADTIATFDPEVIVLAGWMLILSPAFLDRFPGRIVNVHPALLPDGIEDEVETSRGWLPALRGAHTVRDALRSGLPLTGATVHIVTPVVDAGPVILREEVPILSGDDEERLHERIKAVEHRLLPRAIALVLQSREKEHSTWETA